MNKLDTAYFMHTLKFLKSFEKQYRAYTRWFDYNADEYRRIAKMYHMAYYDMKKRLRGIYGEDYTDILEMYVNSDIVNTIENAYLFINELEKGETNETK